MSLYVKGENSFLLNLIMNAEFHPQSMWAVLLQPNQYCLSAFVDQP